MAVRPAFCFDGNAVKAHDFEFEWSGGFALSQKRKNISALHASIGAPALEVSTKSESELGRRLSAFNLTLGDTPLGGVPLECVFQAGKIFEHGGPYTDLLTVHPRDAKHDERLRTSGRLIGFTYNGESWPLTPKTAFYDYIYIKAALNVDGLDELTNYDWFTDIEFNPKKSVNTQARSAALLKAMIVMNRTGDVEEREKFIRFHRDVCRG